MRHEDPCHNCTMCCMAFFSCCPGSSSKYENENVGQRMERRAKITYKYAAYNDNAVARMYAERFEISGEDAASPYQKRDALIEDELDNPPGCFAMSNTSKLVLGGGLPLLIFGILMIMFLTSASETDDPSAMRMLRGYDHF